MTKLHIRPATPEDAPSIARAICMGVGEELVRDFAGPGHTPQDVEDLFTTLARREDSQYSYLNALMLCDEQGRTAGAAVGYDGGRLLALRDAFFAEAHKRIGYEYHEEFGEETTPEEYYLDTLAVWPEYRGNGGATTLIRAMQERARATGLPLGLLVDKENHRARRLYEFVGFRKVGERPFAGEMMDNMRIPASK